MRGKYKKVPVDVDEIFIDPDVSKRARVSSFLRQVKDPYVMKVNGTVVEMEYAAEGMTMEETLKLMMGI